jgi:hypothetical protein
LYIQGDQKSLCTKLLQYTWLVVSISH